MGNHYRTLVGDESAYYARTVNEAKEHFLEEYGAELVVVPNEESKLMKFVGFIQKYIFQNKAWFEETALAFWWIIWVFFGKAYIFMPKKYVGTKQGAYWVFHEGRHLHQYSNYSTLGFLAAYFLFYFPVLFSLRFELELDAKRHELVAIACYDGLGEASRRAKIFVDNITGKMYLFATLRRAYATEMMQEALKVASKVDAETEVAAYDVLFRKSEEQIRNWQTPDRDWRTKGSA